MVDDLSDEVPSAAATVTVHRFIEQEPDVPAPSTEDESEAPHGPEEE